MAGKVRKAYEWSWNPSFSGGWARSPNYKEEDYIRYMDWLKSENSIPTRRLHEFCLLGANRIFGLIQHLEYGVRKEYSYKIKDQLTQAKYSIRSPSLKPEEYKSLFIEYLDMGVIETRAVDAEEFWGFWLIGKNNEERVDEIQLEKIVNDYRSLHNSIFTGQINVQKLSAIIIP